MFKSSLLRRLYADFVIVIGVCAIVINVLLHQYIKETTVNELNEGLLAQVNFLKELALPALRKADPAAIKLLQHQVTTLDSKNKSRLTVISYSGLVIADSRKNPINMNNHLNRPEVQESLLTGQGNVERFSETVQQNMKYLALLVKDDNDQILGFVRVALPLADIQANQKKITLSIIAGCLLAAIIALILGFYFSRRFSKPIIAFTKSADIIAKGDFEKRISIKNKDEIGQLAQTFNVMAANANDRVQRITEEKNKLVTILSGLVEGVIAIDENQKIIHINEAAERTLAISKTAISGESVWTSIDNIEIHEILEKIFNEGGISHNQVRIPGERKDIVIEVYGAALGSSSSTQRQHGAILVLHDVSDLEMLETVRRDFVINASHELKTPLTAIRGIIETILLDEDMDKEMVSHFLRRVQSQTNRLVNIVSDLMALSRLEAGKETEFEVISLKDIVIHSFNSFKVIAQEKEIKLVLNTDTVLPQDNYIFGDAHAITQLLDNLIDNAIKYTPSAGQVKINMKNILSEERMWVCIEVYDDGLGISKADQGRIFERFYRVDKGRSRDLGGTGLGLAIAKHITEQHKGKISIKSEEGHGSIFTVTLPVYQARTHKT
jgi:two-component system phosphate regulon sensor histidine kinase PhoR